MDEAQLVKWKSPIGGIMPSTCVICQEAFPSWMCYHMHMEMHHKKPVIVSTKRNLSGVKSPLANDQKAIVVARLEHKLGQQHFYGE